MELQDIAVWTAILVAGGTLAFLAFGRRGTDVSGQITGRLEQLAAQQAASQNALSERLQAQERALAAKLDERLGSLQDRVGQTLQSNAEQAGQSLTDLGERLAVIDAAQSNIAELSGQVVDLQNVLSNKQARGAFGEVQLQDIVQSSLPAQTYEFQAQSGQARRLPADPAQSAGLHLHRRQVPAGILSRAARGQGRDRHGAGAARLLQRDPPAYRAIAEKYIVPGETADSALMFLPSEAVYAELHASFPNLVDEAGRARVWIVSPTTLMATLTTIRAVLKDVRMREQAHIIQKKVGELGLDVNRLGDRVDKLQRHFGQVVEDVRQVAISSDKIAQKAAAIKDVELGPTDGNITQIPEQPALARLN